MASADTKIEAELPMTCCLGNHPLQNPRLLPCQHSYCTQCIKTELGQERKMFVCPKCQLSIPLKEKEVDQLPEDVLYHITQEIKSKAICVLCKFEDKKTPGTFQCLDCADVLCDQCQKGHTRSSLTREHRVVPVKEIKEGKYKSEPQPEKLLLCDTHSKPNKPMVLEYYCEQCKCLACQRCVIKEHQPKGHQCNSIEEIQSEKITCVTDHLTKLLDLKHQVEDFTALLELELGHNKEQRVKLENEIHNRATKYIEIIEKVKEEILEKIKGHFDTENSSILTKVDDTKNRIIRIDSLVSYTQTFLKHGTKSQFLQHEHEIIKTMAEQRQQMNERKLEINSLEISKPRIVLTEASIREAFGKIEFKPRNLESTAKRERMCQLMKEPKVLFCHESSQYEVYDLTVTEAEEIIVVYSDSRMQWYCSDGGPTQRKIQRDVLNVVAKDDTLFLCDNGDSENIVLLDFFGKVKKTINLQYIDTECDTDIKSLAVDDVGSVYISSSDMDAIYKWEPNETRAKFFIREGKHPDLKEPRSICVTPGGEVVVSNFRSNTILVYGRMANFLWQYKGQGNMTLSMPMGVCCDRQSNIYICDSGHNRIQVINNEVFLGYIEINGFHEPWCIDVDKDNNIVCCYVDKLAKIKVWE